MVRGLTARCRPRCSTKKRWSRDGKDGEPVGSTMVILPAVGGKAFEALADDGHEVRDARQIPIGVGHFGMADIGGERGDGVVDVGALILPKLHAPANEGVPQIVNANQRMGATGAPPEVAAQPFEDAM